MIAQLHGQLLANTIGHAAGVLLFGIMLALLARRHGLRASTAAAALALVWNFTSLVTLGGHSPIADAFGFAALSLLPATLLRLCLGPRFAFVTLSGYALSFLGAALHAAELFTSRPGFHRLGLLTIAAGFGLLTVVSIFLIWREHRQQEQLMRRLAGSMALFLLALSMAHFGTEAETAGIAELLLHQAGMPLALFVLLQDVRFVLVDAFLRFLANVLLAGLFAIALAVSWPRAAAAFPGPYAQAVLLLALSFVLILYALSRNAVQRLLTRLVFRTPDQAALRIELRRLSKELSNERAFLESAGRAIAQWMSAPFVGLIRAGATPARSELAVPLSLSNGRAWQVLLGERAGARRYLSEDLDAISGAAAYTVELADRLREEELRRLVSQAELRALQAQIHPHFLFNAFNTLYGVIPKDAPLARQMVLNLSDLFRYFFRPEQALVTVEEEMRIVNAYLDIEKLRLGARLSVRMDITGEASQTAIPALSIQPLVENAIKHAIAPSHAGGSLSISAHVDDGVLMVTVADSGSLSTPPDPGTGTGLENVRRRLALCYADRAKLDFSPSSSGATVSMRIPVKAAVEAAP